jgi:hypothetical protein
VCVIKTCGLFLIENKQKFVFIHSTSCGRQTGGKRKRRQCVGNFVKCVRLKVPGRLETRILKIKCLKTRDKFKFFET